MLWKILCQTKQLSYVFYSAFSFSSLVFPVLFSFSRSQLPPKSNDRLEAREKDGRSIFWFLMAFWRLSTKKRSVQFPKGIDAR